MSTKDLSMRQILAGIAVIVGGWLVTSAWTSKESRSDHDADIARVNSAFQRSDDSIRARIDQQQIRDSAWRATLDARSLRTLCAVAPSDQDCPRRP